MKAAELVQLQLTVSHVTKFDISILLLLIIVVDKLYLNK